MVNACCVFGCKSNTSIGDKVIGFRFPRNPNRRKEWIAKIPTQNLKITRSTNVCINHFNGVDVERNYIFKCANGDPDIIVSIKLIIAYIYIVKRCIYL